MCANELCPGFFLLTNTRRRRRPRLQTNQSNANLGPAESRSVHRQYINQSLVENGEEIDRSGAPAFAAHSRNNESTSSPRSPLASPAVDYAEAESAMGITRKVSLPSLISPPPTLTDTSFMHLDLPTRSTEPRREENLRHSRRS